MKWQLCMLKFGCDNGLLCIHEHFLVFGINLLTAVLGIYMYTIILLHAQKSSCHGDPSCEKYSTHVDEFVHKNCTYHHSHPPHLS